MAMNEFEAASSVQTNNIATQSLPYSFQFTAALTGLIGSYLDDADLEKFSSAGFVFFPIQLCQKDLSNRKYIRKNILPHVFKANPDELAKFLAGSISSNLPLDSTTMTLDSSNMPIQRMLLTKASFQEGYESSILNKFICFRHWRGVSALTAAAYSGDEFFVIRILAHLVQDDRYRIEALHQLEEVEKRITEHTIREYEMLESAAI